MNFNEALKKLNIEDYGDRIWHSNSHGELMHIADYVTAAERIGDDASWFRPIFLLCVERAKAWGRPESCFQHMPRLMPDEFGLRIGTFRYVEAAEAQAL